MAEEFDLLFKILINGDVGTGKSCMLFRYAEDDFSDCYVSTVGVDFKIKTIFFHDKTVKLQIWDLAGNPRYRSVINSYYQMADGVITVFDVTYRSTFENVPNWLNDIVTYGRAGVRKILVGNKCDLLSERCVTDIEAKSLAQKNDMEYIETSAKENTNLDKAFFTLCEEIYAKLKTQEENKDALGGTPCRTEDTSKATPDRTDDTDKGTPNQTDDTNKQTEAELLAELMPGFMKDIIKQFQNLMMKLEDVGDLENNIEKLCKKVDVLETKVNDLEQAKGDRKEVL